MQNKLIASLFTLAIIFCGVAYIISNSADGNKLATPKFIVKDSIIDTKVKNREFNDTL